MILMHDDKHLVLLIDLHLPPENQFHFSTHPHSAFPPSRLHSHFPACIITSSCSSQASNGLSGGYACSLPSTPVVSHRELRVTQVDGGGSVSSRSLRGIPRRPSLFKVSRCWCLTPFILPSFHPHLIHSALSSCRMSVKHVLLCVSERGPG